MGGPELGPGRDAADQGADNGGSNQVKAKGTAGNRPIRIGEGHLLTIP